MTLTQKLTTRLEKMTEAKDMTTGKILPIIMSFAIPIMIGNLFQQLYNMVDTDVVGRGVGAQALAAVGVTSPVTQLLLGLMIGMTSGMSVVIAQHFGSGNEKKTRQAIASGIVLITIISIFVTLAGLLLCRGLFTLINTPADIMEDAVLYASITFAGTAAAAAYNYEAGVLRAFGNSIIPLLFLALTSLLNVGLDLLYVLSFGWGVGGAAIATLLSQLISAILCLIYMIKKVPLASLSREDWKWNSSVALQHMKTGIPMAFFSSLLAISFLVLQAAVNFLGSADVAAYTAGSKMDTLVYQIMGAFGTAISTFAAQNYGKGLIERVEEGVRKSLKITIAISLCLTVIVFLFGRSFMALFIDPSQTEIMANAIRYIRITSVFYIILGVNFIVRFALTRVGKTIIPMAVGISEILTRALVTWLLVYRIGFMGMTLASPSCWLTSTLMCVICYRPMMKSSAAALAARLELAR